MCTIGAVDAVRIVKRTLCTHGGHQSTELSGHSQDDKYSSGCHSKVHVPKLILVLPVGLPGETTYSGVAKLIGLYMVQHMASNRTTQSAFDSREIPEINPCTYAYFLFTAFHCSWSTALYTLIYLERAAREHDHVQITPYTTHRLVLSAFVVASKYVEDKRVSIRDFAYVGGVAALDLKHLEFFFLQITCFQLYVSQNMFDAYTYLALTMG